MKAKISMTLCLAGLDTDTVACVAGSIAGLYYGNIPLDWLESLRNKTLLEEIITNFSKAIEVL